MPNSSYDLYEYDVCDIWNNEWTRRDFPDSPTVLRAFILNPKPRPLFGVFDKESVNTTKNKVFRVPKNHLRFLRALILTHARDAL